MGASKREIARFLDCSLDSVLRRQRKMARWALLSWGKDIEKIKINESIAFDGLENFSFSQYEPNNINHAVGRDSLYIYDFNLSAMNRKGRMSPRQKKRKGILEEAHGRFPGAIGRDAKAIFERLLEKTDRLTLHTDNHYAYRNALKKIGSPKIFHLITLSKVARNYKNRLFAINHTDMLTRHHLADFKRETIAFAKHTISMQESFVLLSVYKNYMRPCFIKPHKNKRLNKESPAMLLGLKKKVLSFQEFFRTRPSKFHVKLNQDWQNLFERLDPVGRHPILAYQGV